MIANAEAGAQLMMAHLNPNTQWHWESKVISETPGMRQVTHYSFRPDHGKDKAKTVETVGKFYADDSTGKQCFQTMHTLHSVLARQDNAPLALPRPIFYSDENRLLALHWVGHKPFPDLINQRNYRHYLRLAGLSLAYLHRTPIQHGTIKTLDDHLTELITPHPLTMAKQLPEQSSRIEAIVAKLQHAMHGQKQQPTPVPLHRDFHLRQLFHGNRQVWLIDWDMYALGDPALDVGNFLVYLQTHYPLNAQSAESAFLQGYRSLNPTIGESNINLFQIFTYLRLACKAFRLRHPEWQQRVGHLLGCCETLLSKENIV